MSKCIKCDSETTGKSKYCKPHAAEAREAWRLMIASKAEAKADDLAHFKHAAAIAHEAGHKAAMAAIPVPMVINGYAPIDDGVCGFAWVTIRPATSRFAKWAGKTLGASKAYGGGLMIWISDYHQSMTRKEAYACAYARTLGEQGIPGIGWGSRID
jgi:hypothetical protein